MIVEIIVSGGAGLLLGSYLEKRFIEYKLWSFERTLKNISDSINKILEDSGWDNLDKVKMVRNHLAYLSGKFTQLKNIE